MSAHDDAQLRLVAGLMEAAAAAGCADTFRAVLGLPEPDDADESTERWAGSQLSWDELWDRTSDPEQCSDRLIVAFANRLSRLHTRHRQPFGVDVCQRIWGLLTFANDQNLAAAHLLAHQPVAVEVAEHAVRERWVSTVAGYSRHGSATAATHELVGARLLGAGPHPAAVELLRSTRTHTPVTLALLAEAGVAPTAEFAELLADGKISVEAASDGSYPLADHPAYSVLLCAVSTLSPDARVSEAVLGRCRGAAEAHLGSGEQFDVVLPASWRAGDAAVTARAAAIIDWVGISCEDTGATTGWILRGVDAVGDEDVAALVAGLEVRGAIRVAMHGPPDHVTPAMRRLVAAEHDPAELLRGRYADPERAAAIIAAAAPGIVRNVAAAYGATPVVTHLLQGRLIDATGGTADGLELLAGLIDDWSGTVDDLCDTICRLRSR